LYIGLIVFVSQINKNHAHAQNNWRRGTGETTNVPNLWYSFISPKPRLQLLCAWSVNHNIESELFLTYRHSSVNFVASPDSIYWCGHWFAWSLNMSLVLDGDNQPSYAGLFSRSLAMRVRRLSASEGSFGNEEQVAVGSACGGGLCAPV